MSPVAYLGGGGTTVIEGGSGPNPTDAFSIGVKATDANAAPADATTYAMALAQADTNSVPIETSKLSVTGYADATAAPTDGRSAEAVFLGNATTVPAATNWATPANAQGAWNSTTASLSDSAVNQISGTLVTAGINDPPADLSTWTITKVEVLWWTSATLSAATTSRVHMEWQYDGGIWRIPTGGENIGGSTDGTKSVTFNRLPLLTPLAFDITAEVAWTWARLNTVEMRVRFVSAVVAETASLFVDAFGLRVTATKNEF